MSFLYLITFCSFLIYFAEKSYPQGQGHIIHLLYGQKRVELAMIVGSMPFNLGFCAKYILHSKSLEGVLSFCKGLTDGFCNLNQNSFKALWFRKLETLVLIGCHF